MVAFQSVILAISNKMVLVFSVMAMASRQSSEMLQAVPKLAMELQQFRTTSTPLVVSSLQIAVQTKDSFKNLFFNVTVQ